MHHVRLTHNRAHRMLQDKSTHYEKHKSQIRLTIVKERSLGNADPCTTTTRRRAHPIVLLLVLTPLQLHLGALATCHRFIICTKFFNQVSIVHCTLRTALNHYVHTWCVIHPSIHPSIQSSSHPSIYTHTFSNKSRHLKYYHHQRGGQQVDQQIG